MLNLDPAKLLVIAVVAIILLGPDKLPQVARQVGGVWRSFNEFRHRMETEVRSSMPDLPSTTEIARLARSPSALLDHLSNMGTDEDAPAEVDDEQTPELDVAGGDAPPSLNGNGNGNAPEMVTNGSVPDAVETAPLADTTVPTPTSSASLSPSPATPPDVTPEQRSPDVIVPGDPSLN
jgi:sec-independent protein translocase protein TatB